MLNTYFAGKQWKCGVPYEKCSELILQKACLHDADDDGGAWSGDDDDCGDYVRDDDVRDDDVRDDVRDDDGRGDYLQLLLVFYRKSAGNV